MGKNLDQNAVNIVLNFTVHRGCNCTHTCFLFCLFACLFVLPYLHLFSPTSTSFYDFVNEVPSYRCAKFCVVVVKHKQANKQRSLPFSLYIVGVISLILSKKEKVETLRSVHCGCFYTHTHKETKMCRESYFVCLLVL